ncbi:TPA: DUF1120 domain-containing protein [Pseudomonas aeruginosa]|nr:DUF1120 domain-containing protein [Pseudomonas aeruginosa]
MRFASKLSTLALAVAGMAAAFGAQAQSIDVRVIGTITPPACTPSLAGGGVVDYGRIPSEDLSSTSPTALAVKSLAFTINCEAPTRVAVRVTDGRASSRVPGIAASIEDGLGDEQAYGLGVAGGKNIGVYGIQFQSGSITLDGEAATNASSLDEGATWTDSAAGWVDNTASRLYSWRKSGDMAASVFTTMASMLNVRAVIDSTSKLDLSNDIELDGLASLEMVYL